MSAPRMELRRAREPAPAEMGVYYGQLIGANGIIPVTVSLWLNELVAWTCGDDDHRPLNHFDWFGPVPTCVESVT